MLMKTGEQWHCTNPVCRCEILVQASGGIDGVNPRCSCGAIMKKRYVAPNFRYLDFLRCEEPEAVVNGSCGV